MVFPLLSPFFRAAYAASQADRVAAAGTWSCGVGLAILAFHSLVDGESEVFGLQLQMLDGFNKMPTDWLKGNNDGNMLRTVLPLSMLCFFLYLTARSCLRHYGFGSNCLSRCWCWQPYSSLNLLTTRWHCEFNVCKTWRRYKRIQNHVRTNAKCGGHVCGCIILCTLSSIFHFSTAEKRYFKASESLQVEEASGWNATRQQRKEVVNMLAHGVPNMNWRSQSVMGKATPEPWTGNVASTGNYLLPIAAMVG